MVAVDNKIEEWKVRKTRDTFLPYMKVLMALEREE